MSVNITPNLDFQPQPLSPFAANVLANPPPGPSLDMGTVWAWQYAAERGLPLLPFSAAIQIITDGGTQNYFRRRWEEAARDCVCESDAPPRTLHSAATEEPNAVLAAALEHASNGRFVVPCDPETKQLLINDGSDDPATVKQHWTQWPHAAIGLVAGKLNGLVALNVQGDAGLETLRKLGVDPLGSASERTPNGLHIFYKWREGLPENGKAVGPGVTILSDSGWIITSPFTYADGRKYEELDGPTTLADVPQAIIDALHGKKPNGHSEPTQTPPIAPEEVARTWPADPPLGPYHYRDEDGTEVFEVVRREDKKFAQRRRDPDNPRVWVLGLNASEYMRPSVGQNWQYFAQEKWDGWTSTKECKKFEAARRVLYCLPELVAARQDDCTVPVFICEGEKDVLAMLKHGAIATTNPMGAGKWRDEYSEQLRGFQTFAIVADKDIAGREHAQKVAASLATVLGDINIRIIEVTGDKNKDPDDFLSAGGKIDEIYALADTAPQWTPPVSSDDRAPATSSDPWLETSRTDRAIEDWKARAKSIKVEDVIARHGIKLKRVGVEFVGACPGCGGKDRFAVHMGKQVFNCRQCGAKGDVIALEMFLSHCDFDAAVTALAGTPRPKKPKKDNDNWRDYEPPDTIPEGGDYTAALSNNDPRVGANGTYAKDERERAKDSHSPSHGKDSASAAPLPPLTIEDWMHRELQDPDYLLGTVLSTTTRAMLYAPTGLGKTLFAMSVGFAVADGSDFLHWTGRRRARVLYIDGEMSARLLKKRVIEGAERHGSKPANFLALSHEDIPDFQPLNTPAGRKIIENLIVAVGGVDFIIFDSVMCLVAGDMKEEEPWQQILPWVKQLTARGIGQLWIHHTGHDESRSYGTKTREWQLDLVMRLEILKRDDIDVSFTLSFPKARERTPDTRWDFQDVQVALIGDVWEHTTTEVARPKKASPLGSKFLDALTNVLVSDQVQLIHGRRAASENAWQAECIKLGLLDPKGKPNSFRSLFSKYRRELVAANLIACDGEMSWRL